MASFISSNLAPFKNSKKHLCNRNKFADYRLRHEIERFEKQKVAKVSDIDKDRLDIRDFLKQISYCQSDFLPAAKNYLGRDISKRPGTFHRRTRAPQTAPATRPRQRNTETVQRPVTTDKQWKVHGAKAEQVVILVTDEVLIDREKISSQLTKSHPNIPEAINAQSVTKHLHDLPRAKSEMRQTRKVAPEPTAINHSHDRRLADSPEIALPSRKATRNRVEFMKERPTPRKTVFPSIRNRELDAVRSYLESLHTSAAIQHLKDENNKLSHYKNKDIIAVQAWMDGDENSDNLLSTSSKFRRSNDYSESVKGKRQNSTIKLNAETLSNILAQSRKAKVEPLEIRMKRFYDDLDQLKAEAEREDEEKIKYEKRRWILLTRGLKAAIDESSDGWSEDYGNTV